MEHPFLQRWGGVMDNANATIQLLRTIRAIRLGIFCWLHAPVKFHLRGEHINLILSHPSAWTNQRAVFTWL